MLLDGDGRVSAANGKMTGLLGMKGHAAVAIGMDVSELLPEGAGPLKALLDRGEGSACLELPELEGRYLVALPLGGEARGLSVTAADLKTLGAYFGAIPSGRPANRLHDGAVAPYKEGVIILDSVGSIVYANEKAASLMGESRSELEGRSASRLAGSLVSGEWLTLEVIASRSSAAGLASCPRGEKAVFVSGMPVFGPDGSLALAVFTLKSLESSSFDENSSAQDRELFAAFRDEMTGPHFRPDPVRPFVKRSQAMRKALDQASRLSRSGVREILITGEPGSGKCSVARFIHDSSPRSVEPFVRVACSRRESSELEKEIFGAEAGHTTVAGILEAVGRGTVFLEDADKLPADLQKRIADFLSTREYRRAGGSSRMGSDATLVFTAAGDPNAPPEDGRILAVLAEALAASSIAVPPLRSRREDMAVIARTEMVSHNVRYGLRRYVDPGAADAMSEHDFPVNVRELKSALHKAAIFSSSPNVGPYLSRLFSQSGEPDSYVGGRGINDEKDERLPTLQSVKNSDLNSVLDNIQRKILVEAIRNCKSTREMAVILGISQAGVSRKLKKFKLDAPGKFTRK
jgi:DNA-binding NtrC family response regulator